MTEDLRDTKPAPPPPVILVVEHVPDFQKHLADALRREGYEVAVAATGEEALAALEATPTPDLIALDLAIPRMSGEEFLRVKAGSVRWARIPVVVISEQLDGSGSTGAVAVASQPPDWDALLDDIRHRCPIIGRGGLGGPAGA